MKYLFLAAIALISACISTNPEISPIPIGWVNSDYIGKEISVAGEAGITRVHCTLKACSDENPCCNICGGSLTLKDGVHELEIRGSSVSCSGNECSQSCSPMETGRNYIATGTLRESFGEIYLELDSYSEAE